MQKGDQESSLTPEAEVHVGSGALIQLQDIRQRPDGEASWKIRLVGDPGQVQASRQTKSLEVE